VELGIDKSRNLVYEGSGAWGHAIWPSPIVLPLAFTTTASKVIEAADGALNPLSYVFREDAFDPVSRVRYGRLYQAASSQPKMWHVGIHPALPHEERESNKGVVTKELNNFHTARLNNALSDLVDGQPLAVLGTKDSYTVWTILSRETTVTGDELLTLKSRQTFGALPNVDEGVIPAGGRSKVLRALRTFQEDIYRAAPESVVDRAREAATVVLSVYEEEKGIAPKEKELGKLIRGLDKEEPRKNNVINAARMVAIFHSRGKHAEKEKRLVRELVEQDAELAVQCVGTILCDLGWAQW